MELDKHSPPNSFVALLQKSEFCQLKNKSHEHQYRKGEYIIQASNTDHAIYILVTGRVKISRISHVGNELIQWFCMPGDIFGISGENQVYNNICAQALTDCQILKIKKSHFNQLILDEPGISLLVIDKLSSRIHTLGDMILYMANDNANIRFVKLMQHMIENYGRHLTDCIHIDIPTTHQDLADMMGSCRQTVSSIVSALKRDGVLNINRKGINIYKPQYLIEHNSH